MRGPRLSLRWRIVIAFSSLMVLVTVAVGWALLRFERFFLLEEGQKRVEALAHGLASSARDPLLAGDQMRLAPLIGSVMTTDDVLFSYVADHRGTVVHHSDLERIGRARAEADPVAGELLRADVPVMVEETLVGTAVVVLSPDFIDRAMRTTALGLLVPLAVGSTAGVIGMLALAGYHVRRIERLEHGVRALGAGDLDVRVALPGRDELGRLASHFNGMVEQLQQARSELETNFSETTRALAAAIEAKDPYTRGHCERVAGMSVAIANSMGFDRPSLRDIELAAILHDVGKIGVSRDVLTKEGPLDEAELAEMRLHPEIGARILEPLSNLTEVARYVLHHHEHLDGSGYPAGLSGEAIPLPARIINLVDAYDAMTSNRPYRPALDRREAIRRIESGEGAQFDPGISKIFRLLHERGAVEEICSRVNAEYGL